MPHFPLRVPGGQRGDGQAKNHGHPHDQQRRVLEDEAAAGRKGVERKAVITDFFSVQVVSKVQLFYPLCPVLDGYFLIIQTLSGRLPLECSIDENK